MLPTIIEKTQPITGATSTTSSKPGLIPYIPAGADGYLHTSGEFKSITNNEEINYFSPQLDYDNQIVIEKFAADFPDPPATEAEELEFNEFIAPSNGQLIAYGGSYTSTGQWLGYWAHIYPADNSPKLKINFTGYRLPSQNYQSVFQLCSGPYTLSKGDKFYMVCNGAVKKLDRTVYTFIPYKYQNVTDATLLNAYYSTEINYDQLESYPINPVNSDISNDITIATYTATANGMALVYVQNAGASEQKTWAGFRINITTSSGKTIRCPSNAVRTASGTALLQTVIMNKNDTISVIIPATYTNVEIGNIQFAPFKYQKTNVLYKDRIVRKLGEIFIYAGIDTPDNSLPLDGQIISECNIAYPDFYTWVVNNSKTITLEEYETKMSQYSQCGYFGLDTTTKTVRLPKIKAFIQNAESVSEIGEAENAGLPNITGDVKYMLYNDPPTPERDGAISIDQGQVFNNYSPSGDTALRSCRLVVNASWHNSIYGNSTTVTPDNVKYRYFIYIKNEFKETSNPQLIEGRRELDRINKITISIPQIPTPTAGNTTTFLDYTAPDNGIIIIHTLQSESTGYNLTGFDTKIIPYDDPNNTLNIGFTGVYSTPGETNKSGSNIEKYYELNKGDIIQCTLQSNYNSINSGGAYFIPYKYKESPYTQYTQGELAAIASDASAPGDTFIDISVTDTDFSYTCPENGLFSFEKKAAKISEWVLIERQIPSGVIVNTSSGLSVTDHDNLTCSMQAAKGDIIKVTDRLTGAFNRCRFIPNKGSGKLYSETYTKDELEQISTHAIMPVSDRTKYTTYSVTPVNGSLDNFHTAPTDGYVRVIIDPINSNVSSGVILATYISSTTSDDITAMLNGTSMIEKEILCQTGIVSSIRHRLSVPIEKGNKFMLWMNTPSDIQVLDYSFIPCNGA